MSDQFDQASDLEEADRTRALRIARDAITITPIINCLNNCGPESSDNLHGKACTFYKECLEDWQIAQRAYKERPAL